jgi:hypothetical protein
MKWWHWAVGTSVLVMVVVAAATLLVPRRQFVPYVAPPPRLPRQVIGEWIQVYPRRGAKARVFFNADSTFRIDGSPFAFVSMAEYKDVFHPTHWFIDDKIAWGSVCILERRKQRGACYSVRLVADTLWFLGKRWPVLVRVRDGVPPPSRAWDDTHLHGRVEPVSNSFREAIPVRVH